MDDFETIITRANQYGVKKFLFAAGYLADAGISLDLAKQRDNFYEIGNNNILHIMDEFSKNISLKNKRDYNDNKIIDGLNTLNNVDYVWNYTNNMVDINNFTCLYNPNDKTVVNTSVFKRPQSLQKSKIGTFDFYNFK